MSLEGAGKSCGGVYESPQKTDKPPGGTHKSCGGMQESSKIIHKSSEKGKMTIRKLEG